MNPDDVLTAISRLASGELDNQSVFEIVSRNLSNFHEITEDKKTQLLGLIAKYSADSDDTSEFVQAASSILSDSETFATYSDEL